VQRVMVFGSWTLATKVEDMQRLVRTETAMVRWMYNVKLKDRSSNAELLARLGVEDVLDVSERVDWVGSIT